MPASAVPFRITLVWSDDGQHVSWIIQVHTGLNQWNSIPHNRTPFFWLHFLILSSSLRQSLSGGVLSSMCLFISQEQVPLSSLHEHFPRFCDVSILFSWTPSVLLCRNKSIFCLSFDVIIILFFFLDTFLPFCIIATRTVSWTLIVSLCREFLFLNSFCTFMSIVFFSWRFSAPSCQFSFSEHFLPPYINSFPFHDTFTPLCQQFSRIISAPSCQQFSLSEHFEWTLCLLFV